MTVLRRNWRISLRTPLIILALAAAGYAFDLLTLTLIAVFGALVIYCGWQLNRL